VLYAVRVKPQHPIGTRHRAGMCFVRDYTYMEEVPEAVIEDKWLEVREATEDEVERFGPRDEAEIVVKISGDSSEAVKALEEAEDAATLLWLSNVSVKDVMEWAADALAEGNEEAPARILRLEQSRGDDARKTLISQLEEIVTSPPDGEGDEDPQGS